MRYKEEISTELSKVNEEIEKINKRKSSYIELSKIRDVITNACLSVCSKILGAVFGISIVIIFSYKMVNVAPFILHTLAGTAGVCACVVLACNVVAVFKTGFSLSGLRTIIDAYEQGLGEDNKRMNELLNKKDKLELEDSISSYKDLIINEKEKDGIEMMFIGFDNTDCLEKTDEDRKATVINFNDRARVRRRKSDFDNGGNKNE